MNTFYDCELPSIFCVKIVDAGQGRQLDACPYSHRSYIVIDPLTCGAYPIPFLSKNSAPSRDTTCASKNPQPKSYLRESTILTYGLNKILQVSCHRCNKAIKIGSKSVGSISVREIERCTNL
jgi:hypothetical protein